MYDYFKRQSAQDKTPIFVEETDQVLVYKVSDTAIERQDQTKGKKAGYRLFVLVYEGQWSTIGRNNKTDRERNAKAGNREGISVWTNQRCYCICRKVRAKGKVVIKVK